jgi:hypothetical protein
MEKAMSLLFHLSFAYLIAKIPEHKICAVKVERR